MPYKVQGNKVMHKKAGKWRVKQTCRNSTNARRAVRLLQGVEHGWTPTGKPAVRRRRGR